MKNKLILFFSVFIFICLTAGCTFLSDNSGEVFTGEYIEFDVGYDAVKAGYWIGFQRIYIPTGDSDTTIYFSPMGTGSSAFVSIFGVNSSFTKDYEYNGYTLTVKGTFSSSTRCEGTTSYNGNILVWTAEAESE